MQGLNLFSAESVSPSPGSNSRTARTLSTKLQKDEGDSAGLVAVGCVEVPPDPVRIASSAARNRRNHSEVPEITGDPGGLRSMGGESSTTFRGVLATALAP